MKKPFDDKGQQVKGLEVSFSFLYRQNKNERVVMTVFTE